MTTEKIPRRMQRFYRKNDNENYENNDYYGKEHSNNKESFSEYDNAHLPTMEYEDVKIDEKNYQKIKEIEQMNLEQKLTLLEVEKFKKQNKRLPNEKETEKMADTLYLQFKNNPEMLSNQEEKEDKKVRSRRERRRQDRKKEEKEEVNETITNEPIVNGNIKELFSSNNDKKVKNEFDLGLDLGDESELEEMDHIKNDDIEEIKEFGEESCPSCGKKTDKIIYCSKCGNAYCKNCSENIGKETVCPKCKTKNKI